MSSSVNEYKKKMLIETLERVAKRANALMKCIDDIDEKSYTDIEISLDMLDKSCDIVLQNQKKRGKKFLSNEDIDKIFKEVHNEAKKLDDEIKKFGDFDNEKN